MNRLAAILPVGNVITQVEVSSKKRVFDLAGVFFENMHGIARNIATDNLLERERVGSTALGHGVAIPHGRVKGLKNPLALVMNLKHPVAFDAPDHDPVSFLIFLLIHDTGSNKHLEILSQIAELLSESQLREKLKTETNATTLHQIISQWQPSTSLD